MSELHDRHCDAVAKGTACTCGADGLVDAKTGERLGVAVVEQPSCIIQVLYSCQKHTANVDAATVTRAGRLEGRTIDADGYIVGCPYCATGDAPQFIPAPAPEPQEPKVPTAADLPEGDYAMVEMMGHSSMVGRVLEVERFGAKLLQVEPVFENRLLEPTLVSGQSLYRFTPCTREVAFARQAKSRFSLPPPIAARLPDEAPPAIAHNSVQGEFLDQGEGYAARDEDADDEEELQF